MKIKLKKVYYSDQINRNGWYMGVKAYTKKEAKRQLKHIAITAGIIPNKIYVGYEVINE